MFLRSYIFLTICLLLSTTALEIDERDLEPGKILKNEDNIVNRDGSEVSILLEATALNAIVKGTIMETRNGKTIYGYKGLRYGKEPERFQAAKLTGPYRGKAIDATYFGSMCPQRNSLIHNKTVATGNIDCLFLNVYTPVEDPSERNLLPVMVYIHGGDFIRGDSSIYQPTNLLEEDVLLVVMHYRLGALSFFTTGDYNAIGNMGLYDQKLALEWVKMYISDFGGDPNRVTIFGQGSGAVSVNYHVLSENSNDFHGAIAQSGSALDFTALDKHPTETSWKLATVVPSCEETLQEYDPSDSDIIAAIYQCMSTADIDEVAIAYDLLQESYDGIGSYPFAAPSVQEAILYPEDYIVSQSPEESLKNSSISRVPMIIGTVAQEGSIDFGEMYAKYLGPSDKANDDYYVQYDMVSDFLKLSQISDPTKTLSKALTTEYLSYVSNIDFTSYCSGMIDMVGSIYYKGGVSETAFQSSLLPESALEKVYVYSFDYEGSTSMFHFHFAHEEFKPICSPGVATSDDLIYLFNLPSLQTYEDRAVMDKMVKLWTLFATYGNPTPDENDSWQGLDIPAWESYQTSSPNYLSISNSPILMEDYGTSWTITGDSETGVTTESTIPSSSEQTSSQTDSSTGSSTNSPTESSTESPTEKALEECLAENKDLDDERTAFLVTMIIFILLFLIAFGCCVFLFLRNK